MDHTGKIFKIYCMIVSEMRDCRYSLRTLSSLYLLLFLFYGPDLQIEHCASFLKNGFRSR